MTIGDEIVITGKLEEGGPSVEDLRAMLEGALRDLQIAVIDEGNESTPATPIDTSDDVRLHLKQRTSIEEPYRTNYDNVLDELEITDVASLSRIRLADLLKITYGVCDGLSWTVRSDVLRLLVEYDLPCLDSRPARLFRTNVKELLKENTTLTSREKRVCSIISRDGDMHWLELLAFASEQTLLDIRNIGASNISTLKGLLERLNLAPIGSALGEED